MKVVKKETRVFEFNIPDSGRAAYSVDRSASVPDGSFHRVGYFVELQHPTRGNRWVYTEFDAFTEKVAELGIPDPAVMTAPLSVTVSNMDIVSSDGTRQEGLANGRIEFTPYNYHPGTSAAYDTNDDLQIWFKQGNYGSMQVHSGSNVVWSYNCHNATADLGIGNNATNEHPDWTFTFNAPEYTRKRITVFTFQNDIQFTESSGDFPVNMRGVAHGDTLRWDAESQMWGVPQIQFDPNGPLDKPNFIIALTGQSNSQGCNAWYDPGEPDDQPHERIFGFNPTTQQWEIADLNAESLGAFWHKAKGWQSLAFHFARRLVEGYPDIRPGIINVGVGGQSIARWVKYAEGEKWFEFNDVRAKSISVTQGDIYDLHVAQINAGLAHLDPDHQKVNVVLWHQGESDADTDPVYYEDSVNRVIAQYRANTWGGKQLPFIVGETTGADVGTNLGWETRNVQLRNLNIDADPYTKCVSSADLPTSDDDYGNGDRIHFGARAQKEMGTRYRRAYQS